MSVFCGQCSLEFEGDPDYLVHECEVTGVVPTDPESMGVNWQTIQQKALERGLEEQ